jgi:hypothetical protein
VTTKRTPAPRRAGTRQTRRSKASQARLDAILGAIGDDQDALRKLITAIAEIAPGAFLINS